MNIFTFQIPALGRTARIILLSDETNISTQQEC